MKAQQILKEIERQIKRLPTEQEKQFGTHILAYKAILERLDEIEDKIDHSVSKGKI